MRHSKKEDKISIRKMKTKATTTTNVIALLAIVTLVATALTTTTQMAPVYAAPAKERAIFLDDAIGAAATWTDINLEVPGIDSNVVYATLFVSEGKRVLDGTTITDTLVSMSFYTENGNLYDTFTVIEDPNVFDADGKKLTTATLNPTVLEFTIYDENINPIGKAEITVEATWEGTGDLHKAHFGIHFKSDTTTQKVKGSSLVRDASAEGSLNGVSLGASDSARIFTTERSEVFTTLSDSTSSP
jgi:hypothetical protein